MAALRKLPLRSVLLTSGTLSPLDSFAHELQLGFKFTLENPHVIAPSQVTGAECGGSSCATGHAGGASAEARPCCAQGPLSG